MKYDAEIWRERRGKTFVLCVKSANFVPEFLAAVSNICNGDYHSDMWDPRRNCWTFPAEIAHEVELIIDNFYVVHEKKRRRSIQPSQQNNRIRELETEIRRIRREAAREIKELRMQLNIALAKLYPKGVRSVRSEHDEALLILAKACPSRDLYRLAATHAHPDKGGDNDRMAAVNRAWETLK